MAASGHFRWLVDDWRNPSRYLEPCDRHVFIEISEKDGKVDFTKEDGIKDEDLPELCKSSRAKMGDTDWSLRLLVTSIKDHRSRNTLPYSLNTIEALQEHWHLADACFFNQGQDLGGCAMTFSPRACDFGVKGVYIVIQNLNFCECAMIHDPATRSTWAVVNNIPKWTIDTLVGYLGHAQDIAHMPFLVPILLGNVSAGSLWDREIEAHGHVNTIRIAMKCDQYDARNEVKVNPKDLADMPRRLTASADNVATVFCFAENLSRMLNFLDSHFDEYHKAAPSDVYSEVRDHLNWLQNLVVDVTVKNETVRSAGQAVVSMVYAMLQQKDNEINHQHGGDMRVIAIVTLMFLPSTFISTWFSASFWNFDPKSDGPVASNWVILHFLTSIFMTLGIFIAWRNDSLSRKKKRNKHGEPRSKRKSISRWSRNMMGKIRMRPNTDVEDGDADTVNEDDEDDREKQPSSWNALRQRIVPRRGQSGLGAEDSGIAKMVRKTAPPRGPGMGMKMVPDENVNVKAS